MRPFRSRLGRRVFQQDHLITDWPLCIGTNRLAAVCETFQLGLGMHSDREPDRVYRGDDARKASS